MSGMEWIVRFESPNGGSGPETVASDDLAAEFDGIVVLLLRDHYCQVSRGRARAYSDAFDSFREADVAVVAAAGTAMTDGTPCFDAFADAETGVDSLPGIGVLDTDSTSPRLVHTGAATRSRSVPTPTRRSTPRSRRCSKGFLEVLSTTAPTAPRPPRERPRGGRAPAEGRHTPRPAASVRRAS